MSKLASAMLCLVLLTGCASGAPEEPERDTQSEDIRLWNGNVDGVECSVSAPSGFECDWPDEDASRRARSGAQWR